MTGKKKDTSGGFGFDADFANFDGFGDKKTTNGTNSKPDAWGTLSLDKTNNNFTADKGTKFGKSGEASKVTKFNADYSSDFDQDLESVMQRSLFEQ